MSRGLGQTQHRMLASLSAIQTCQPPGASVEDLLVLWARVEAKTVQDFDYANTYRGLRALERRGLVSFADQSNYTVACLCAHAADEHEDGHGRCRSRRNLQGRYWCYCKRYRPERSPRPSWLISLTPSGRGLVSDEETSRLVEYWQPVYQKRVEYRQRMEATFQRYTTARGAVDPKSSCHLSAEEADQPCAVCSQVRPYLQVVLDELEDHALWALLGKRGQLMRLGLEDAMALIDKSQETLVPKITLTVT